MHSFRTIRAVFALALVSCFLARTQAVALAEADLIIHRSEVTGRASFVLPRTAEHRLPENDETSDSAAVAIAPETLLDSYGPLFGVRESAAQLARVSARTDPLGFTHTRFAQVHRGTPVFSGTIIVHQRRCGDLAAMNGRFYPVPDELDVRPLIDAAAAIRAAALVLENAKPESAEATLLIVDPGWYGDPPLSPRLAWHIVIEYDADERRDAFFIDAHSGKIIDQWSMRHAARDRRVHDAEGTDEIPGVPRRFEGDPPVVEPPDVDSAYDYLGDFYDFLFRAYGWDGPDGAGRPLVATANAGFSGCPNAFYDARLGHTVFCTGTAVDDIVAHEAMHAVTHYTADLIFQNQPGQLNESFSDVFGELVDLFNGDGAFLDFSGPPWPLTSTGPGTDEPNLARSAICNDTTDYPDGLRWLIGEEAAFPRALRDMWNPTCYGMPDRANHSLQTCPRVDNGGTHTGSSIPNHAFAILTDGKQFNGYTVRGIGPIKAGAVWFRALTQYMTPADNFRDAYLALTQAAADLTGEYLPDPRTGLPIQEVFSEDDAVQVDLALRAVEMDTPSLCGIQPVILDPEAPAVCAEKQVIYAENFEGGASGWMVSNSGPPTPYDWRLVADLPHHREGVAYFCPEEHHGDCVDLDESAVHELTSPPIHLPHGLLTYRLRFRHYLASEPGYDGGLLSVRLASGRWARVRSQDFLLNPYNAMLRAKARGSSNPLASASAWTSAGGGWGESIVDLSRLVSPAETTQIRFTFAKDGCNGSHGWYVDDVEVYGCPDCNENGLPDDGELEFRRASDPLGPIGGSSPRAFTFAAPPVASSEVTIDLWAMADLGNFGEFLTLWLNGERVSNVFVDIGRDCPNEADRDELRIPATLFNELIAGGNAVFTLTGTHVVDTGVCGQNNFVALSVHYRTGVADVDENGIIDHCENCATASPPVPDAEAIAPRNRYLSFVPSNPARLTALRLVPVSGPPLLQGLIGKSMWVDKPWKVSGGQAFARLTCDRVFHDWAEYAHVHVADVEIVPAATYELRAMDFACARQGLTPSAFTQAAIGFESEPLSIATAAAWGDADGLSAGSAAVSAQDVALMVDILRGTITAMDIPIGDLIPAIPDCRVDARDVAAVIDATKGRTYPFSVDCFCCP